MHPAIDQQRYGMDLEIEDVSVLAPSPDCGVQGFSRNDFLDRKRGFVSGIIGHEYAAQIASGEFSRRKPEQRIECGVGEFGVTHRIEDNDSERTIFDQGIEVNRLLLKFNRDAV